MLSLYQGKLPNVGGGGGEICFEWALSKIVASQWLIQHYYLTYPKRRVADQAESYRWPGYPEQESKYFKVYIFIFIKLSSAYFSYQKQW